MRGGVHCLLPSAYRRHATRSMRGVYPYAKVPTLEQCPGTKTLDTYVGGEPGGKSLVGVH